MLDLAAKKQKGGKKGPPPQGQTVEIAFANIEKANGLIFSSLSEQVEERKHGECSLSKH